MGGKRVDEGISPRMMAAAAAVVVGAPCAWVFLGSKSIFLVVPIVIIGALSYAEAEFAKED